MLDLLSWLYLVDRYCTSFMSLVSHRLKDFMFSCLAFVIWKKGSDWIAIGWTACDVLYLDDSATK